MKKGLLVALTLVMVFTLSAMAAAEYNDGHYMGFLPNSHGDVVVEVNIAKGAIVGVNIISPVKLSSTYEYEPGIEAFIEYPSKVLKNQSADIDVVAKATGSYEDYNQAVQMALDIASGSYEGNKYYGLARNFNHGHVLVEITVDGDKVTDVRLVTAQSDKAREMLMPAKGDDYKSAPALKYYKEFPEMAKEAVNEGVYEVDIISGATHSGHSYNEALRDALEQAGFDI